MSGNSGVIKQVMGPVVDVEFPGQFPAIYNALRTTNKSVSDEKENLVLKLHNTLVTTLYVMYCDGLYRRSK